MGLKLMLRKALKLIARTSSLPKTFGGELGAPGELRRLAGGPAAHPFRQGEGEKGANS